MTAALATFPPPTSPPVSPKIGAGVKIFLGCAAVLVVLGIVGGAVVPFLAKPFIEKMFGIDIDPTVTPPGDVRAFDPIANYEAIKQYAGENVQLVEINAIYVRSDGTLDLKADLKPGPNVEYKFVREIKPPGEAPPIGAGVGESGMQWQTVDVNVGNVGQTVYVNRMGGSVNARYHYTNKGMQRTEGSPSGTNYETTIPDPVCSFASLWKQAIDRGAPAEAVAVISFVERGYTFEIRDTDFEMTFALDCVTRSFKGQEVSSF
jgi:hypothetical protein